VPGIFFHVFNIIYIKAKQKRQSKIIHMVYTDYRMQFTFKLTYNILDQAIKHSYKSHHMLITCTKILLM